MFQHYNVGEIRPHTVKAIKTASVVVCRLTAVLQDPIIVSGTTINMIIYLEKKLSINSVYAQIQINYFLKLTGNFQRCLYSFIVLP